MHLTAPEAPAAQTFPQSPQQELQSLISTYTKAVQEAAAQQKRTSAREDAVCQELSRTVPQAMQMSKTLRSSGEWFSLDKDGKGAVQEFCVEDACQRVSQQDRSSIDFLSEQ